MPARPSSLKRVSTELLASVTLENRFARELAELGIRWQAQEVPEPRLLTLNEPLAAELGLDPTFLRSAEGVEFLVGNRRAQRCHPGRAGICRTPVRCLCPAAGRWTSLAAR